MTEQAEMLRRHGACFLAAAFLSLALLVGNAFAQATDSASVSVSITIAPQAEITFPEGFDFVIRVPDRERCFILGGFRWNAQKRYRSPWDSDCWFARGAWWWPVIKPVRIPFKVEGNATATVTVRPGAFLRIRGGRYLGKALGPRGGALGYDIAVHFPAPSRTYAWLRDWDDWDRWDDWDGFGGFGPLPRRAWPSHLPWLNSAGTRPLSADLGDKGVAYGVIYLVTRRDWTASGQWAAPGNYHGSLDVTLTADD